MLYDTNVNLFFLFILQNYSKNLYPLVIDYLNAVRY